MFEQDVDVNRLFYHKIDSVFKRDPETNFKTFLWGEWSREEFGYLADCEWDFSEKVDGTSVKVAWDGKSVTFGGHTKDSLLYAPLVKVLQDTFTLERLAAQFPEGGTVLFGEGYGAKIQKGGGNYIPDGVGFILFDVVVGRWYLRRDSVVEIADAFGVPVVPIVGIGTLWDALNMVKEGFESQCAFVPGTRAEGLVMRPHLELFGRNGRRVITKVKYKDFHSEPKKKGVKNEK